VIIYQAPKVSFLGDLEESRIDQLLVDGFRERLGRGVSPSEVGSWRNSLQYVGNVLEGKLVQVPVGPPHRDLDDGWYLLQRAKYLELNKGPTIDSFWIDFVGGKIPLTEGQQAEFISKNPAKEFRSLCVGLIVNCQHLSRSQKIEVLHLRKTLDRTNFTDVNCIELAISGGFPAEEYSALKLEYKQAKSDRKLTIFRLFLDRHWGKPF
jgi:hypothetical protein